MLKLPASILSAMVDQARREMPNETCGYLSGVDNEVRALIPMTNIDHSPEHFSFDPSEQFEALKASRSKGLNLIAVFHSHPETPARLSDEDLRLANDPKMLYLIISLAGNSPEVKGYRVIQKVVTEVSIEIVEGEDDE